MIFVLMDLAVVLALIWLGKSIITPFFKKKWRYEAKPNRMYWYKNAMRTSAIAWPGSHVVEVDMALKHVALSTAFATIHGPCKMDFTLSLRFAKSSDLSKWSDQNNVVTVSSAVEQLFTTLTGAVQSVVNTNAFTAYTSALHEAVQKKIATVLSDNGMVLEGFVLENFEVSGATVPIERAPPSVLSQFDVSRSSAHR